MSIENLISWNYFLLDLTGSQDGSVHIWEWGHPHTVAEPRAAGTFAKVTRVRFSQHGNKFGVADGDGNLSLFNVGLTSSNYRPFYVSLELLFLYSLFYVLWTFLYFRHSNAIIKLPVTLYSLVHAV